MTLAWLERVSSKPRDQWEAVINEREAQIQRAKIKLETAVRQRYGDRPFAYIRFHVLPATAGIRQEQNDTHDEIREVTISQSKEFVMGEVQLCIFLGVDYVVVDWDYVMEKEEKEELGRKKIQEAQRRWGWRRGKFFQGYSSSPTF